MYNLFDGSRSEAIVSCKQGHLHSAKQTRGGYTFNVKNALFYLWDPKLQRTRPGESVIFEEPDGMVKIILRMSA